MNPSRDHPVADDEEWEDLARSGLLDDADQPGAALMGDEEIVADDGEVVRKARGMPAPKQPSKEDVARHNLNHLPYRSWCPHCVASRRPNSSHRTRKSTAGRPLPLFCADYAYVRKPDKDLQTMLVGKLYPQSQCLCSHM